jgi:hypothetical protein
VESLPPKGLLKHLSWTLFRSLKALDLSQEKRAGVGPNSFGGRFGESQRLARFRNRHAGEIPQLDQLGLRWIFQLQACQCPGTGTSGKLVNDWLD